MVERESESIRVYPRERKTEKRERGKERDYLAAMRGLEPVEYL